MIAERMGCWSITVARAEKISGFKAASRMGEGEI